MPSTSTTKEGLAKTVALGGGDATDCAGVSFGVIRAGGFLPVKAAEVVKPWQARIFAVAELAPSMTLKSYWVQSPRGDGYCGS